MGHAAVRWARQRPGSKKKASEATVLLTLDFIDSAKLSDGIEFRPTVLRIASTLAFVDCRVGCGKRPIARHSAYFRTV